MGSALASIDDPSVQDRLQSSIEWLKQAQWDDEEGLDRDQDWYGGVGYGNREAGSLEHPDDARGLHEAGVSPEDPAVQKALQFVSRTQNLTETNRSSGRSTEATTVASSTRLPTAGNRWRTSTSARAGRGN